MKNSIFFKTVLCFFMFAAILTSCAEEEDFDITEELEEEIENQMLFSINSTTSTYDASAAYCDNGVGVELLLVSNNQAVLTSDSLDYSLLQLGDYVVFYLEVDGFSAYGVSTVIETTSPSGAVVNELVQDDAATFTLNNMDSTSASGSLSGTFTLLDGTVSTYSATFNADVVYAGTNCY